MWKAGPGPSIPASRQTTPALSSMANGYLRSLKVISENPLIPINEFEKIGDVRRAHSASQRVRQSLVELGLHFRRRLAFGDLAILVYVQALVLFVARAWSCEENERLRLADGGWKQDCHLHIGQAVHLAFEGLQIEGDEI